MASAIGMTVNYRSGTVIGQSGVIVDERRARNQMEYLVKFADGSQSWVLAKNVRF